MVRAMQRLLLALLACSLIAAGGPKATANPGSALSSAAPAQVAVGFDAGLAAFERQDWQAVIDIMAQVIEEEPWHDEAYNRMGFAYRKLGDFDRALEAYDKALRLNPDNRGAMEYLGETYLELGRIDAAEAMLTQLEAACATVAGACEEWRDLKAAYDARLVSNMTGTN